MLLLRYTVCGTEIGEAAATVIGLLLLRYAATSVCAVSGTESGYAATRVCAVSGTEIGYAATRCVCRARQEPSRCVVLPTGD
eukprot:617771-Rhodomonas_salina.1